MIHETIGLLAYESHMDGKDDLSFTFTPEHQEKLKNIQADGVLISDGELKFSSLERKNQVIAEYSYFKNKKSVTDGKKWFDIAHDIWVKEIRNRQGSSDKAAGRLLAIVHEEQDIYLILRELISTNPEDVYQYTSLLSNALPHLKEISAKNIILLFDGRYELNEHGRYLNGVLADLEKILVEKINVCKEIHSFLINDQVEINSGLYKAVLLALSVENVEKAIKMLLSDISLEKKTVRMGAVWTLGRLFKNKNLPETYTKTVADLLISYADDSDIDVSQTAISSMADSLSLTDIFDNKLFDMVERDQFVLTRIAQAIWQEHKEIKPKTRLEQIIHLLDNISIENEMGLDYFEYALSSLIKDDNNQELVIESLSNWIKKQTSKNETKASAEIRKFDSLFYKIANKKGLLSIVITEWLLSGDRQLSVACSTFLSLLWVSGFKEPKFSKEIIDGLDSTDIKFLVRRMLGFITDEEHLISLSLSLLGTKDAPNRVFGLVYSLLVEEIGSDFPSQTIDTIESLRDKSQDDVWGKFYDDVINAIEAPFKERESLPRLNELKPSFELQRKFSLARSKSMSQAMDDSRKGSLTSQLFTEVPIKAGKGWFHFREGSFLEPSFMQKNSISKAIPRRDVLDEVGSKIRRLSYRYAQKEDE